jgi:hypothetical protein
MISEGKQNNSFLTSVVASISRFRSLNTVFLNDLKTYITLGFLEHKVATGNGFYLLILFAPLSIHVGFHRVASCSFCRQ